VSTLLITDSGEMHDANSHSLRRELGISRPDFDFLAYVVRNIGFIGFRRGDRALRVQLRPSVASKVALTRLFQLLAEEQPQSVVINLVDEPVVEQILGGWRRALPVIDRLIGMAQDSLGDCFLSAARDIAALDACDPLAGMFNRWCARNGMAEVKDIPDLVGRALAQRHVVVEVQDAALTLRHVGGGFPTYKRTRRTRRNTMDVELHPDFYYGKWVKQRYQSALARREPVLADVDALIAQPQRGRSRWRYRHLLLPIRGRDAGLRLLGASVIDASIDLRVKG
jgi:hypothetical protein